jgi:hypothetical protein
VQLRSRQMLIASGSTRAGSGRVQSMRAHPIARRRRGSTAGTQSCSQLTMSRRYAWLARLRAHRNGGATIWASRCAMPAGWSSLYVPPHSIVQMRRLTNRRIVEAPKEVERGREHGRRETHAPDGCAGWFVQEWEMLDSEWFTSQLCWYLYMLRGR